MTPVKYVVSARTTLTSREKALELLGELESLCDACSLIVVGTAEHPEIEESVDIIPLRRRSAPSPGDNVMT